LSTDAGGGVEKIGGVAKQSLEMKVGRGRASAEETPGNRTDVKEPLG